MKCTNCGREIPNDSKFCPDCGHPIKSHKETITIDFDICIDEINKCFILKN